MDIESIKIIEQKNVEDIIKVLYNFRNLLNNSIFKTDEGIRKYAQKLAENAIVITAYVEDDILGCMVTYMNDEKTHCMYTPVLAIKDDIGLLGTLVLAKISYYAAALAKKNNIIKSRLEVYKDNKRAIKYYKLLSYEEVGVASDKTIYMEADVDAVIALMDKFYRR